MKAYLSNRLYVPKNYVTTYMLNQFTYNLDNQDTENIPTNAKLDLESISDSGLEDLSIIETYREYEEYYGFSRGNLGKIYEVFRDFDIEDQRAKPPFKYDLQWNDNKKLRTMSKDKSNQTEVFKEWLEYEYGQIKAPCRWGKTVVLAKIICALKVKTLVIAHQIELLKQLLDTFYKFTNILELQKEENQEIIGYVNEWEDMNRLDVAVMPYQRYVIGKNADIWLDKCTDMFGAVFVDEVFKLAATCYSRTINTLNPYYRLGVSATPYRKDALHVIVEDVMGPVVVEGCAIQLTGNWICHYTKYDPTLSVKNCAYMTIVKRLSYNTERNDFIVQCTVKDIQEGHYIVIGVSLRWHCEWLTHLINEEGIIAEAFYGGSKDRKHLLARAISGETRVIVARQTMLLGIDIPRWSCYYNVIPVADKHNFYQYMSRIRTPLEGKKTPLIRDFIDKCAFGYATYNTREKVLLREGFTQIPDNIAKIIPQGQVQGQVQNKVIINKSKSYGEIQVPRENNKRKKITCKMCSTFSLCLEKTGVTPDTLACKKWKTKYSITKKERKKILLEKGEQLFK